MCSASLSLSDKMARIASMDGGCANSLQIHPVHDLLQFSILRVLQIRIFYGLIFTPPTSKKKFRLATN